jgi:hypothetical protein
LTPGLREGLYCEKRRGKNPDSIKPPPATLAGRPAAVRWNLVNHRTLTPHKDADADRKATQHAEPDDAERRARFERTVRWLAGEDDDA